MKKALFIVSLISALMLVGVPQATAQNEILVNVVIERIAVSISPGIWDIPPIALEDTVSTTGLQFTATNDGNVNEDFDIVSSNSANWTCGDPLVDPAEFFAMKAQGGDLGIWTDICGSQDLKDNVPDFFSDPVNGVVGFDLQFTSPTTTVFGDTPQQISVTVSASRTP